MPYRKLVDRIVVAPGRLRGRSVRLPAVRHFKSVTNLFIYTRRHICVHNFGNSYFSLSVVNNELVTLKTFRSSELGQGNHTAYETYLNQNRGLIYFDIITAITKTMLYCSVYNNAKR